MKKLLLTVTLGLAIALAGPPANAQTQTVKKSPAPAAESTKPAEKAMPMYSRADVIDVKARTFSHRNKDGKEVKHVVTVKTLINNNDKPAKFEDIKVGDFVSGLRLKKSDTEYEVVKITKFGPEAKKAEKAETKPKK